MAQLVLIGVGGSAEAVAATAIEGGLRGTPPAEDEGRPEAERRPST